MRLLENSIKETPSDFAGLKTLESILSETRLDFGIIRQF